MSAQEQMRQMLDQLMGTARDGDESKYRVKFDDPRVCKSFLLACCPHDILSSTRMDLGDCPKVHDLALRADYDIGSKKKDYFYDIDAMEHLESFIADCDRRTELAKRRLKETQEELSEEANGKADVIHQLGEQIGTKLARAEEVGAEGNVEESLKQMEEVEVLKKEKATAEIEYRNSMPASSYQQQKLRVCEVCSAYLGIHDNDRRLADHFGGKLHLGFITIREKLNDLRKSVADRREQREIERALRKKEREEEDARRERGSREGGGGGRRSRSRSGSRQRRRSRSRSASRRRRSRSRSHSRRKRSRSRSRGKRHKRSRSRSRERRRRSGSRSKKSRRRSRSRSRSRRSRSHSHSKRSRRSRSRSKDKTREEAGHSTGDGENAEVSKEMAPHNNGNDDVMDPADY